MHINPSPQDDSLEKLRAAVRVGETQFELGEETPYSAVRLKTITAKALNNARQGKKVSADTTP